MTPSRRRALLIICGVAWLAALWLPAVELDAGPVFRGLDLLRQGWTGWRDNVFAWYANPLLGAAIAASWFDFRRTAVAASSLGLVLALSSMAASDMATAAGRSVPAFGFGAGFFVWLAAFAGVFAIAALSLRRPESTSVSRPRD